MTDPFDEGHPPSGEPPFEEEAWEADIALALRSLPPVEPPVGYLDRLGDEFAHRRRGRTGAARPLLAVAAAVVVLAGFVGVLRIVADRDRNLDIDELVTRHAELADETAVSATSSTGSTFTRDLVERAARVGQVPSGWRQDAFWRDDLVVSLFEPTAAAPPTAASLSDTYGPGRALHGDLRSWRLGDDTTTSATPGSETAEPAGSLVVADGNGLVVVVGMPTDALDAVEAQLADRADAEQAATASRRALLAAGFTAVDQ